jgi:hypothetical protein
MTQEVLLALAILAVAVACIPLFAYPFVSRGDWLDPYTNRRARWMIWGGGLIGLALFIALARGG